MGDFFKSLVKVAALGAACVFIYSAYQHRGPTPVNNYHTPAPTPAPIVSRESVHQLPKSINAGEQNLESKVVTLGERLPESVIAGGKKLEEIAVDKVKLIVGKEQTPEEGLKDYLGCASESYIDAFFEGRVQLGGVGSGERLIKESFFCEGGLLTRKDLPPELRKLYEDENAGRGDIPQTVFNLSVRSLMGEYDDPTESYTREISQCQGEEQCIRNFLRKLERRRIDSLKFVRGNAIKACRKDYPVDVDAWEEHFAQLSGLSRNRVRIVLAQQPGQKCAMPFLELDINGWKPTVFSAEYLPYMKKPEIPPGIRKDGRGVDWENNETFRSPLGAVRGLFYFEAYKMMGLEPDIEVSPQLVSRQEYEPIRQKLGLRPYDDLPVWLKEVRTMYGFNPILAEIDRVTRVSCKRIPDSVDIKRCRLYETYKRSMDTINELASSDLPECSEEEEKLRALLGRRDVRLIRLSTGSVFLTMHERPNSKVVPLVTSIYPGCVMKPF